MPPRLVSNGCCRSSKSSLRASVFLEFLVLSHCIHRHKTCFITHSFDNLCLSGGGPESDLGRRGGWPTDRSGWD